MMPKKDGTLPFRQLLIARRYDVVASAFEERFGTPLKQIRKEMNPQPTPRLTSYASEMISAYS